MSEHPLSPLADAMHLSAVKAACYFLAWLLGTSIPRLVEGLMFTGITGRQTTYDDGTSAAEVAFTHLLHPLGFLIVFSHIVLFALFVRFELRYRWILWPLASGVFWRMFMERL